ncbi:CLUMA_CG015985, isoform A [Clunio marinus]|uniref:CLUMA_CG015985, isoform A n=1 Tax=Clunio marinus TaxID=568069 RepID=A0A1J1IRF3_9DIPT|nr:CLUMA_CG015985, isoform A [Clunio marinus]
MQVHKVELERQKFDNLPLISWRKRAGVNTVSSEKHTTKKNIIEQAKGSKHITFPIFNAAHSLPAFY